MANKDIVRSLSIHDENGRTELHYAADGNYSKMVKILLKYGADPNAKNDIGETPLYIAARTTTATIDQDTIEIIRNLLKYGADPNAKSNDGWMPLHNAASNRNLEAVKLLIKYNADVKATDNNGWTPLHFAAYFNEWEIAKILIENDADPHVRDINGRTAIDIAYYEKKIGFASYANSNNSIFDILEEAMRSNVHKEVKNVKGLLRNQK